MMKASYIVFAGSEVTADPPIQRVENKIGLSGPFVPNFTQQYPQSSYSSNPPGVDMSKDTALIDKMATLRMGGSQKDQMYPTNTQAYMQYSYGVNPTSYPSTSSNVMPSSNATTVSNTQYPYVTSSEQYSSYGATQGAAYGSSTAPVSSISQYGYGQQYQTGNILPSLFAYVTSHPS